MTSTNTVTVKSGLSLGSILGIVFIILKLCNVITWSWLWVLCPLWIGIAIWLAAIIIGLAVAFLGGIIAFILNK